MLNQPLEGLIERVGKATGPSRYDDCHLWVVGQGGDARMVVCDSSMQDFVWERGIDGMWVRNVVRFRSVPKYTSSIDAALGLVERLLPGWDYGLDRDEGEFYATIASAGAPMSTGNQAQAASMPLAIILATLRAIQSTKTGGGE